MKMRSLLWVVLLGGCASSLQAVKSSADVPGLVHVSLSRLRSDVVTLDVANQSKAPLVVDRDAIVLKTPRATLARESGGLAHSYVLAPGGHQQVNVRFLLGSIADGETVSLVLDRAITPASGGAPIAVPDFTFKKD